VKDSQNWLDHLNGKKRLYGRLQCLPFIDYQINATLECRCALPSQLLAKCVRVWLPEGRTVSLRPMEWTPSTATTRRVCERSRGHADVYLLTDLDRELDALREKEVHVSAARGDEEDRRPTRARARSPPPDEANQKRPRGSKTEAEVPEVCISLLFARWYSPFSPPILTPTPWLKWDYQPALEQVKNDAQHSLYFVQKMAHCIVHRSFGTNYLQVRQDALEDHEPSAAESEDMENTLLSLSHSPASCSSNLKNYTICSWKSVQIDLFRAKYSGFTLRT